MLRKIKSKLKTEDNKRLFSNFLSLSVLQGANYILPLITLPYLVRVLGVEYFGLLAFATAIMTYFMIIADYGFQLTGTREISKYRNDRSKVIEIFSSIMIIKFILMLFSIILLSIIVFSFEKFSKDWEIYFFTFGIVVGQVLFPVWFFQGMEKMKYITYLNIVSKVIFTVAVFIFVQEKSDFYIVPILISLGSIIAGIISLYVIKNEFNINFEFQSIIKITSYFKNSWNVFIVEALPSLYSHFSTLFLGFFSSMEVVGYYALAMKLIDVLNNFIYVIRNVTYPYLVRNSSKFKQIALITISVGLLFFIATLSLSHLIVPFIFGDIMKNSLIYIYILSLSPLLIAISVTYGSNRLLVFKKDREMRNITIVFSLTGFIFALILIPTYSAIGAASTVIFTRLLMTILTYSKGRLL